MDRDGADVGRGVVVLMVVVFAKRPANVEDLGSVSAHWIAAHRVEAR